jgi:pimeloyl-ACP methyl ester carboxylesterase
VGVGLGLLFAGLAGAGSMYQLIAGGMEAMQLKPPGEMVRAGDRTLHVTCMGEGAGPLIVLENGLGVPSEGWTWVQAHLAARHRVCAYDRAGTGWSTATRGPRDAGAAADDLAALLDALNVTEPIVLAGHSYGGLIARVFAHRYPGKVAGIVLVDSSHEDMEAPAVIGVRFDAHSQSLRRHACNGRA